MSDYLTDREVAVKFGVSWQQVQARCRTQEWPHLRIGKKYRFKPEHIEQIEALCERAPAPQTAAQTWGRRRRGDRRPA